MNKSLVLRNKIYRFCFVLFSFFLFFYLFYLLVYGERGILAYYNIVGTHSLLNQELIVLKNINTNLEDKISRLTPNTLDLEYLDEQLRISTGKIANDELVVIFDD